MWEYQTFSIPLGGATVRDTYGFRRDGGIPDSLQGEMTRLIEAAVERFLRHIAPQGWEPVEAITADALWRAGHVVISNPPWPSTFGNAFRPPVKARR